MKKRILALALFAAMALSLAACSSGGNGSGSGSGSGSNSGDTKKVGLSMPTQSLERWNRDGSYLDEQFKSAGYETIITYSDNDTNRQVSDIQNMIAEGVDLLVVAAIDGEALNTVMNEAGEAGIPVIAYDRLIMNDNVSYYVSFDNYTVGTLQGQYIVEALQLNNAEGSCNIELTAGDPADSSEAAQGAPVRLDGITVENEADALKALDDVKAHGVNALVVFLGNFGPETPETILCQKFDGPTMYVAAAEGDIAPGAITFYRLQCDSEGNLRSYIAQGEVLPVATRSFGGIGVFAIPEMGRFYRHVLIQKRYPHHGAVAFAHCGKALFEVLKYFGVSDIAYTQPKSLPYPTENPLQ